MTGRCEHIQGTTTHSRRGAITNAFRYGVDFVLIDPDTPARPALLSRNRVNLWSVHDKNHGGVRGQGRGVAWVREVLAARGCPTRHIQIHLLTQPSFLGFTFNPVSFWLVEEHDTLIAVIAEVNNTFGDRHSYFCAHPGFDPIKPDDVMHAQKIFHVSPFQDVKGRYSFRFRIDDTAIKIRIILSEGADGVVATLLGRRRPATNRSLLWAALRRPFGALRVVALIYWQAVKLRLKGAPYRSRPTPPEKEVS